MHLSRRELLAACGALAALWPLRGLPGSSAGGAAGNFRYVYADERLRAEFRNFLVNVFHLYPEDRLHGLIQRVSATHAADEAIYRELQSGLDDISPFLGELRYALPALRKQKQVMAVQTRELIASDARLDGYLEIGSTGRYVDSLEEALDIIGERYFVGPIAPTYSPVDMLDRGQIPKAGAFIPLDDYRTDLSSIPAGSLDLITVYIGFHHCPVALREPFFASIREVLSPNGKLIVRDHDVHNEKMWRIVGLAHDVFNMGTHETWRFNEAELRHFYSLATLDQMLREAGFRTDGRRLLQDGDPTLNTLMLYTKA